MDDTLASQVAEGQEPTSGSPQVAETEPQGSSQAQEATHSQVEGNGQSASQEDTRRASDYETARQIKRLAKQMQSFQQALERGAQSQPSPSNPTTQMPTITNDEFVKDPVGALQKIMDAREQQSMGKFSQTIQQREQVQQYEKSRQDAVKMIRTNESIKRDPEGMIRMSEILTDDEYNLDEISKQFPEYAAKLALKIYQAQYGNAKKVQGAPTKAQMVSTATAVTSGGGKANLQEEAAKLQKELMNDPSLITDPAFKTRMDNIVKKSKQEAMAGL